MSAGSSSGWMIVLVILIIAAVFGLTALAAKKRRDRAQAFARARGWQYTRRAPTLVGRWRTAPFQTGHSRRAENVLTGDFHGRQLVSFRYQYTTGSGKNQTTYVYHVVALHLPARLPWLVLTPDGLGASIAKFFGGQDIRFESEAFNKAWRVRAQNERFAFDFIHPRMMERLLAPDARGMHIAVEGDDILIVRSGNPRLEAIDVYANLLYGIIDQIPRHLWLRVGYDPLKDKA